MLLVVLLIVSGVGRVGVASRLAGIRFDASLGSVEKK